MRFANHAGRAVITDGTKAIDVADASNGRFPKDPGAVFDIWDDFAPWASSVDVSGGFTVDPDKLDAPSPKPRQIFAVGLNYADHAAESGIEAAPEPAVFTKFQTSLTGAHSTLELPNDTVDFEAELVAVIGRPGHRISEADAWEHVAGLTVGNDISERTRQRIGPAPQFSLGKSFPGFTPTGPWLVTTDEVGDRDDLGIGCSINGDVMQDGRTRELIFPIAQLVAKLSAIVPLLPGDLIFTGTPAGVGGARKPPVFLRDGDVLETWVEGIGSITSTCRTGVAYPPAES